MDTKYTKSGKKVAVLGKLNNETWIVQEIFVANGQEFPAGENFTEKTLLDEPADTWERRRTRELKNQLADTEQRIKVLDKNRQVLRRKAECAELINKVTEKYQNIDISQLNTLCEFMSGQITHIVQESYRTGYEIVSLVDAIEDVDNYNYPRFEGLKLVSLFGCQEYSRRPDKDWGLSLKYRVNQYRDGSGGWKEVFPCKSQEEACDLIEVLIAEKDAGENLISLKEKYRLKNPTEEKIKIYRDKCLNSQKQNVQKAKDALAKEKSKLLEMKGSK